MKAVVLSAGNGFGELIEEALTLYGNRYLDIHKKRDYDAVRESKTGTERGRSESVNSDSDAGQNGTGRVQRNIETDRADGLTSAFFMKKVWNAIKMGYINAIKDYKQEKPAEQFVQA